MANGSGRGEGRGGRISMPGVIASGLICWGFPPPWFRWDIRTRACRSACRLLDGHGRKKWCWQLPLDLRWSAGHGGGLGCWSEWRGNASVVEKNLHHGGHRGTQGKVRRTFYYGSEWRGMFLWLKKIFTTEDTEVHGDAQGKVRRSFYCWSEWRGMLAMWLKKSSPRRTQRYTGMHRGK